MAQLNLTQENYIAGRKLPNYREGEAFALLTLYLYQQGMQGLQGFAFCILTVNDYATNLSSKQSVGFKYKNGIFAELCLKF